jgi:hypothetical protein
MSDAAQQRIQPSTFGARDRLHFMANLCGAPWQRLKRKPLGAHHTR